MADSYLLCSEKTIELLDTIRKPLKLERIDAIVRCATLYDWTLQRLETLSEQLQKDIYLTRATTPSNERVRMHFTISGSRQEYLEKRCRVLKIPVTKFHREAIHVVAMFESKYRCRNIPGCYDFPGIDKIGYIPLL